MSHSSTEQNMMADSLKSKSLNRKGIFVLWYCVRYTRPDKDRNFLATWRKRLNQKLLFGASATWPEGWLCWVPHLRSPSDCSPPEPRFREVSRCLTIYKPRSNLGYKQSCWQTPLSQSPSEQRVCNKRPAPSIGKRSWESPRGGVPRFIGE